jgi:FlaA1/EpsC-like NDP-sugar epimerase
MRVRFFGQYVHISMAVLAAIEAGIFLCSMLLALRLRLGQWHPVTPDNAPYAVWLCAGVFGAANLISGLAFGLYSSRQRARTAGVFVRLVAAIGAALVVTAAVFYVVPSLWLGRGVLGLSALFSLLGVGIARGISSRMMDESIFKRRVLVYGVGQRTAAI